LSKNPNCFDIELKQNQETEETFPKRSKHSTYLWLFTGNEPYVERYIWYIIVANIIKVFPCGKLTNMADIVFGIVLVFVCNVPSVEGMFIATN
jgi:hypothetical protein